MINVGENKQSRAGRYVQQPAGYRAFIPTTQTVAAILRMREEYRARITERLGRAAGNGHRIMERLFDHPIVTVGTVRKWLDVTPAGANQLVNRLVDIGLLHKITGYARNRRFRFEPHLRLFEEPEEGKA